nr:MAG TPA: hypothetical protein [Caudoviricetes sp.]
MLKQFNIATLSFRDPVGNEDGWINIATQAQIEEISESITNGGDVWVENGKIHCSGKAPSEFHVFDRKKKQFVLSGEKQAEFTKKMKAQLINNIDVHAASIYSTWTRFESEYRERQAAAEAFKSANYQGDCSRYITDFAKRAGLNNQAATDLILVQAAGLEKLQVELANQRMRKYELKVPGLTTEKMQSIHDDIIKQMDALMEAYNNG